MAPPTIVGTSRAANFGRFTDVIVGAMTELEESNRDVWPDVGYVEGAPVSTSTMALVRGRPFVLIAPSHPGAGRGGRRGAAVRDEGRARRRASQPRLRRSGDAPLAGAGAGGDGHPAQRAAREPGR